MYGMNNTIMVYTSKVISILRLIIIKEMVNLNIKMIISFQNYTLEYNVPKIIKKEIGLIFRKILASIVKYDDSYFLSLYDT